MLVKFGEKGSEKNKQMPSQNVIKKPTPKHPEAGYKVTAEPLSTHDKIPADTTKIDINEITPSKAIFKPLNTSHCECNEAIQTPSKTLDCHVANAPRNDANQTKTVERNDITGQSKTKKLFPFLDKIRKVKNFEIYLAVGLILIMIAIYLTTFGGGGSGTSSNKTTGFQRGSEDTYARELESKLVSTLGGIKGAGSVSAMVTVVGSATLEIAYNIDEKSVIQSGGNGSATTTTTVIKTPVIVNGSGGPQPLVIMEIKPQLKGVVIVASGANDVGVRLQLLRAVQTLIADDSVRIEIFAGK